MKPISSESTPEDREPPSELPARIPRAILVLGIVSFLTDVSSEAIFAVLPIFVTSLLGASAFVLGAMEGLADFAASSLDMLSGYLSDRSGRRKPLAVLGYGFSSLAKTVLLVASTAGQVFAFRVVERLGKSIRGAPRDALLSGLAPRDRRGTSFGVQKAFDKAGAIVGPLLAYLLLSHFGQSLSSFHRVFALSLIPAFASVALLAFGVRERPAGTISSHVPLGDALRSLGPGYRHYLASAAIFSGAYFSFAFLLLAAARAGFLPRHVALLYALFNVSFTLASIPVGRLGDKIGRRALLGISYVLYASMSAGFAFADGKLAVCLLFVLYGVFYAMDEGQSKAYIADLSSDDTRATAIGVYGFVTACVYLPASLTAGLLWNTFGPRATFGVGAGIAVLALIYFVVGVPREQACPPPR